MCIPLVISISFGTLIITQNRCANGIELAINLMKKLSLIVAVIIGLMIVSSCSSSRSLIPQARNSVKTVSFDELNLTSNDYDILDRIEASATIKVEISGSNYIISDAQQTFSLEYMNNPSKPGSLTLQKFKGIVRTGYLAREDGQASIDNPDEIARRLAIYRLINLVREQGGDGVIEPVISTNVEEMESGWGKTTVVYQTTVSGKVVRLKTTK